MNEKEEEDSKKFEKQRADQREKFLLSDESFIKKLENYFEVERWLNNARDFAFNKSPEDLEKIADGPFQLVVSVDGLEHEKERFKVWVPPSIFTSWEKMSYHPFVCISPLKGKEKKSVEKISLSCSLVGCYL